MGPPEDQIESTPDRWVPAAQFIPAYCFAMVQGSMVAFSLNGQSQGAAFKDIPEGTYYPAVSLYTLPEQTEGVTVAFNFGPEFAYPPPQV